MSTLVFVLLGAAFAGSEAVEPMEPIESDGPVEGVGSDDELSGSDAAAALRAYQNRSLSRREMAVTEVAVVKFGLQNSQAVAVDRASWGVFQGGSVPVDAFEFAEWTAMNERLASLEAERKRGRENSLGFAVVGALCAGIGLATALDAALWSDGRPKESVDNQYLGGIALQLTGAALLIPAGVHVDKSRNLDVVARQYTPTEVDVAIEAHNSLLRSELGLSGEQTVAIDTGR